MDILEIRQFPEMGTWRVKRVVYDAQGQNPEHEWIGEHHDTLAKAGDFVEGYRAAETLLATLSTASAEYVAGYNFFTA